MFIRIQSDLHLEFWDMKIFPLSDDKESILVLAGDISDAPNVQKTLTLLKEASSMFKAIVYVFGNHEFYHGCFDSQRELLKQLLREENITNVFVLEKEHVVIDDIAFIGATLWTDLDGGKPLARLYAKRSMADYHVIKRSDNTLLNPQDVYDDHILAKKYIFPEIAKQKEACKKVVVVTHHGVSPLSTHPRFANDPLNSSFVSNLFEKIAQASPDVWIHGHVHNYFDYMIENTRVIANPRGYPNENGEFDDVFTLEV